MTPSILRILHSGSYWFPLDWICQDLRVMPLAEGKPLAVVDVVAVEEALAGLVASGEVVQTDKGYRPAVKVETEETQLELFV